MKSQYSKPISPEKFQASQLGDLEAYLKLIRQRAAEYRSKATVRIEKCLVCGSTHLQPFLEVFEYHYLQCQSCSHISLQEQLPPETLRDFYQNSGSYSSTYVNPEQLAYRLEQIAKPKVEFIMKQLQPTSGTWLDIGCAIGDILHAVSLYPGWKATGIELSSQSIAVGQKAWNVSIKQQLFKTYCAENPKATYTVVSAFGYYGLIPDPLSELELASSLLSPGGYLVVGDTNAGSLSTMVQQSFPELSLRHIIPPNTLNSFTEKSLLNSLKKVGCKPIAIWRFGLDFYEMLKYFCILQPGFQNTPLYGYLQKNGNHFQTVVDRDKNSDYMLVVAQKL